MSSSQDAGEKGFGTTGHPGGVMLGTYADTFYLSQQAWL